MNSKRKTALMMMLALWALVLLASASTGLAQTCGNGRIDPGEQCDDGGQSGGCCTAHCRFAPAGSACYDGNPNTLDSCNATGACVGRYQTTTCGACRDPNDPQDRSYCDLTTNQCVRQTEPCPPFLVDANGNENKCQQLYGRDPATGQCLYRQKLREDGSYVCHPSGCQREECDPGTGECTPIATEGCGFCINGLEGDPNVPCPVSSCTISQCSPAGDFLINCDAVTNVNCYALNRSTCQVVQSDSPGTTLGCREGEGCLFAAVSCAPPPNPCEELVRDPNAPGCCTYRPRDCAAEYGNNPNYTYSCNPTAANGVCIATPKPPPQVGPPTSKDQCKCNGWQRFNYPRAFKNEGDCIRFVNTGK